MLTIKPASRTINPVIAKSMAGFSRPYTQERNQRSIEALFLCKFIYGGLYGSVFGCAVLLCGTTNPVQPATLLFSRNGGSSRTKQEYTVMALLHPYPVDEVITPVDRALSVISLLQVAAEYTDQFQIQGETAQNLLWLIQLDLEAAVKANNGWSEGSPKRLLGEGDHE